MERSRGASLVLPFALLGLCGGWMATFELLAEGWPLLVSTPLCAGLLGAWLRTPAQRGIARVAISTLLAGLLNGILCLFLLGGVGGHLSLLGCIPFAGYFGLLFSLPFVPATVAVAVVARRVGRAREGSLLDGADRRAVWRTVATVIALGAMLMSASPAAHELPGLLALHAPRRNGLLELTLTMTLGALALVAFDGRAMARLQRWIARAGKERDPMRLISAPTLDLGIGDQLFEEVAPARGPYREADRVLAVVRGNPGQARAALASGLTRGALSLGLCGAATAYQLLRICLRF